MFYLMNQPVYSLDMDHLGRPLTSSSSQPAGEFPEVPFCHQRRVRFHHQVSVCYCFLEQSVLLSFSDEPQLLHSSYALALRIIREYVHGRR